MQLEEKAKVWGGTCTVLFYILLLLLLLFCCFEHVEVKEEDGVPVSMGMPDMGGNDLFEPTPESEVQEVAQQAPAQAPTPAPATPAPAVAPNVATQDLEQTAAVPASKKKQEKTSTQPNAAEEEARKQKELQRQEEIRKQKELAAEQARIKKEEEARKKAEAEALAKKKAEEDAIRQKASNMANVFKKNTASGNGTDANSSGVGNGSKPGVQGSPNGTPGGAGGQGGKGNVWSLEGRQIVGTLPRPSYTVNEEGYVIVDITVDNDGNVVGAEIKKSFGITSPALRNAALQAAKKAKFSNKSGGHFNQHGTITYNFKLR
ncbi:MAG: cell envelope integrity protein TolA [Paludibacteraceae bacterium]|nr:cell envelope integrity protein TolA [Paludibacteraceae bacterium]